MRSVRAFVVEDEPLARNTLHSLIAERPELCWIGDAPDGDTAVARMAAEDVELVFLDVNLPGMSGIEMLSRIHAPPIVVFTTAHQEFAVTAFELGAIDYLLKPFGRDRFARAVERALPMVEAARARRAGAGARTDVHDASFEERMRVVSNSGRLLTEIFVRDRGSIIAVRLADVAHFEADGDYVAVHAGGRRLLVYINLGDLAERLDPGIFMRVHRSHIINLSFLRSVAPIDSNRVTVLLRTGARIAASRSGTRTLRQWMRVARPGD